MATITWFYFRGLSLLAQSNGERELERILFHQGLMTRGQALQIVHQITNNRFTDEQALDYFFKIKGLQVINLNDPISYWTRKYLLTPTKVKLNYFEQVKFYETFLNYPHFVEKTTQQRYTEASTRIALTEAAQELIKNSTLSKRFA
jgi:hypothetical protein